MTQLITHKRQQPSEPVRDQTLTIKALIYTKGWFSNWTLLLQANRKGHVQNLLQSFNFVYYKGQTYNTEWK